MRSGEHPVDEDPVQNAVVSVSVTDERRSRSRLLEFVDRWGVYCWRLIGIGIVALACLWLLRRTSPVVIPIVVAVFLARVLAPLSEWLRRRGWRPSLAAVASLVVFFAVVAGVVAAIAPALADEADSLGPTLSEAFDDIEDWLVEDSPFEVSRATVDDLRQRVGQRFDSLLEQGDDSVIEGATLVAEVIAGAVLAVLLTFFMLRDGARFVEWAVGRARPERREPLRRAAAGGWAALGGYLRGAGLLGLVEAVVIGVTLLAVGGGLVVPVVLLTFFAAFVPIVGAVVAGIVATLVALVTAGTIPALIVGVVALVVQQLDNDVLAPIIYGRSLRLHPVVVLLSVVTGGALFGIAGTVIAVPLVAVAVAVARELRPSPQS